MKFPLIVFDWDGTLMDSEARIVACLQAAARDAGVPVPSPDAARDIIGLGLAEAIATLFRARSPVEHERLVEGYRHHWLSEGQSASPLFDGARDLLAELEGRGHLLAVATGKSRRGLDKVLEETGLGSYFVTTRCADETFSKPHPQMLLDILDFVGMAAGEAIVVGDTEYDMQMARNAGASAIGIAHGVHTPERLMAHGAMRCVDDLHELRDWLASN